MLLFLCFQAKVGTVLTLVVDIFIPFTTISILNGILIKTIGQRSKDLDSFGEGSRTSSVPTAGKKDYIERLHRKKDYIERKITLKERQNSMRQAT